MAIIFAFISLFGWGVGDVILTVLARKIGSNRAYFASSFLGIILVLVMMPYFWTFIHPGFFALAVLLNILRFFGNISYVRGLELGNASLTGTFGGSFIIVTVILSVAIFGEILNPLEIAGICFVVLGILIVSFNLVNKEIIVKKREVVFKSLKYGLFTMCSWGIFYALIRIPVEKIGWYWAGMPEYVVSVIMLPLGFAKVKDLSCLLNKKLLLMMGIFIVLVNFANFSYNLGLGSGYTSVVAPIAGSSPVLFVLLSRIFFKDRLTKRQYLGIALSLVGIILISISSGSV